MRGHFERSQFEQAKLRPETARRKEFVNAELTAMSIPCDIGKQVAKQPIHNERRTIVRRQLAKGNFELIQGVQACFVHARILARRPNIHSGKQER